MSNFLCPVKILFGWEQAALNPKTDKDSFRLGLVSASYLCQMYKLRHIISNAPRVHISKSSAGEAAQTIAMPAALTLTNNVNCQEVKISIYGMS